MPVNGSGAGREWSREEEEEERKEEREGREEELENDTNKVSD